ncbi:hypothetical protein CCHR01_03379 [Colletotrichum chrysophilum]|uniref:Uncharacterized protein n=1 Tax=Colletotrichum chrysophilum TaxID=1836956 RepID=A0AAD9ASY6_9PEZI|nr:hypothetical protein CCHR01_03379 [Colletotrichum chrysophilum]
MCNTRRVSDAYYGVVMVRVFFLYWIEQSERHARGCFLGIAVEPVLSSFEYTYGSNVQTTGLWMIGRVRLVWASPRAAERAFSQIQAGFILYPICLMFEWSCSRRVQ